METGECRIIADGIQVFLCEDEEAECTFQAAAGGRNLLQEGTASALNQMKDNFTVARARKMLPRSSAHGAAQGHSHLAVVHHGNTAQKRACHQRLHIFQLAAPRQWHTARDQCSCVLQILQIARSGTLP